MEPIEIMGIAGNVLLLIAPFYELFRIIVLKQSVKHSPAFVFFIVLGALLNTAYLSVVTSPVPIFNIIQNLITAILWMLIYEHGRA